ncbi:class I SAM-dependent DNA methyltransferase [Beggiatoa leptomitoformis]|uniref:Methyltransferase domain-containing protein n=1 Tax=Beggiatoa leptomitoformis TaxID=288004 RepID=A0A2N9YBF6_9GAMM|nr:class I SAM-dependent methyltransferase [Beggiatoa leptomitoformis]ALG66853.1 methyltransferase domain-containing protein [Beggiatoa leptomitoformis]AUI67793.1 methyltransferase domain-containing protein [Beggiatoa leptomitoformis]
MTTSTTVNPLFIEQNSQTLAARYDALAKTYDQQSQDYVGREQTADLLMKYVDKQACILDAGCGTGLVGQYLNTKGFIGLEGLDISAGMLAEAEAKQCYQALSQQTLGEPLTFADNTFDAIICIGTFVRSHAPSRTLDEFIRITRSGGYILFTLRPEFYESSDFKEKITDLERQNQWKRVEITDPFPSVSTENVTVYIQIWVYQVE